MVARVTASSFYEINSAVEPIARNVFTYIRDSGAEVSITGGDGRTSLAQEPPQGFNVLVVDAFSGDAIPLHLLTTQALELYRKHLAPGGIIAFHISNRHVDLESPIALLARSAGMQAETFTTGANDQLGEFTATWMLVSDNSDFFAQPDVCTRPVGLRKFRVCGSGPMISQAFCRFCTGRWSVSQDVHTPCVIASVFLKLDARRIASAACRLAPAGDSPHGRGRRQIGPSRPAIRTH